MSKSVRSATSPIAQDFAETGRVWLRGALSVSEVRQLTDLFTSGTRPGARIAADDPLVRVIATAGFSKRIATIWPGMCPVRIVSFDKSDGTNWGVPWHQDRVIAVDRRADVPGFDNWSCKGGVWHCEPPEEILTPMLFVRVHLDRNTAENGAMEIAPGNHLHGKLPVSEAAALAEGSPHEVTIADPGDVLILAMLTLHRSLPATVAGSRRVLRIDYSPDTLPPPLHWFTDP